MKRQNKEFQKKILINYNLYLNSKINKYYQCLIQLNYKEKKCII